MEIGEHVVFTTCTVRDVASLSRNVRSRLITLHQGCAEGSFVEAEAEVEAERSR